MDTQELQAVRVHVPIRPSLFPQVPPYVLFSDTDQYGSDSKMHVLDGGMEWQVTRGQLRNKSGLCVDENGSYKCFYI